MSHQEQENANIADDDIDDAGETESTKETKTDIAWEFARLGFRNDTDKWECLLCKKEGTGGAYRVKEHISGYHKHKKNITDCLKSSDEDKRRCKEAMIENSRTKKMKKKEQEELRRQVNIESDEIEVMESGASNKRPRTLGPMDAFASQINPESAASDNTLPKNSRQQNIYDAQFKDRTQRVHQFVARWVYESRVSFNSVDCDSFKLMVEAIGQFGPGYIPPTRYQLREPLLNMAVEKTKKDLKTYEDEWEKNGCSIMTDAWSDRKRRSIMNLCVNSSKGTAFISSKEASGDAHTGEYIFNYLNECIESVGEKNVVQVVTDNASNNMATASMLRNIKPQFFWTPSATHTFNLMLEAIVYDCLERFFPDVNILNIVISTELVKYKNKNGLFGKPAALLASSDYTFDPVGWWCNYGTGAPHLRNVAMKILALTTSSSGCERNWSVFEGIHTKKRNRLDTERMNKLVYVQFNSRLTSNKTRKNCKIDILLANTPVNAQTWMVDGLDDEEVTPGSGLTGEVVADATEANEETQPRRSARNMEAEEIRELDEDVFESDAMEDEVDNNDNFDFEFESEI